MLRILRLRVAPLILLTPLVFTCLCGSSVAAELTKPDAVKLLYFMGYQNVICAAVVNGFGNMGSAALSSPNVAMVIAYGERDGQATRIDQTFFFDKDHGWIYIDIDVAGRRVRLWTTSGVKQLLPPTPNK